jgi:hypothetical protein
MKEGIAGEIRIASEATSIQPWEVAGEKELIAASETMELVKSFERTLSRIYLHTQECKNPECNVAPVFNEVMAFRRDHLLPILKENNQFMYEMILPIIVIYIGCCGDKNTAQRSLLLGFAVSNDLARKNSEQD